MILAICSQIGKSASKICGEHAYLFLNTVLRVEI